jgi:nucleoside-diphosphate-sugar epimerase
MDAVYGRFPKLDDATLIKKLIRCKIENERMVLHQNPESSKDYLHIDDAIGGLIALAAFQGKEVVFNIASGRSNSLAEVTSMIGLDCQIDESLFAAPALHCPVSIDRARSLLNFEPQVELKHGLLDTIRGEQ